MKINLLKKNTLRAAAGLTFTMLTMFGSKSYGQILQVSQSFTTRNTASAFPPPGSGFTSSPVAVPGSATSGFRYTNVSSSYDVGTGQASAVAVNGGSMLKTPIIASADYLSFRFARGTTTGGKLLL